METKKQVDPVIHYLSGFPTRLVGFTRLARKLDVLGPPASISRFGRKIILKWEPIFPGVPVPEYELSDPWHEYPPREITTIENG